MLHAQMHREIVQWSITVLLIDSASLFSTCSPKWSQWTCPGSRQRTGNAGSCDSVDNALGVAHPSEARVRIPRLRAFYADLRCCPRRREEMQVAALAEYGQCLVWEEDLVYSICPS